MSRIKQVSATVIFNRAIDRINELERIEAEHKARITELEAELSRRPAAAPEADADKFCDANCTWLDHHPDCAWAEQPAAEPELLPLPKPVFKDIPTGGFLSQNAYTADQMHAYARAHLSAAGQGKDSERLDAIKHASWGLRATSLPTGGDDYEIGWQVIEYHMAAPYERVVAEVFEDDPRKAIDAAMKAGAQGGAA